MTYLHYRHLLWRLKHWLRRDPPPRFFPVGFGVALLVIAAGIVGIVL